MAEHIFDQHSGRTSTKVAGNLRQPVTSSQSSLTQTPIAASPRRILEKMRRGKPKGNLTPVSALRRDERIRTSWFVGQREKGDKHGFTRRRWG
jgi:hypothetical protein